MRRLRYKARQKRIKDEMKEAWEAAGRAADDPDLREQFHSLPRAPLTLFCCRMNKAVNHGGLVRLAEAFRLENIVFENEVDEVVDFAGLKGTRKWQKYDFAEPLEFIPKLKEKGYRIYALSLENEAKSVQEVKWQFPACIILGREKQGISAEILELADETVAIPMYGMITSLNVGQAGAITVNSAISSYQKQNPSFLPARSASKKLIQK